MTFGGLALRRARSIVRLPASSPTHSWARRDNLALAPPPRYSSGRGRGSIWRFGWAKAPPTAGSRRDNKQGAAARRMSIAFQLRQHSGGDYFAATHDMFLLVRKDSRGKEPSPTLSLHGLRSGREVLSTLPLPNTSPRVNNRFKIRYHTPSISIPTPRLRPCTKRSAMAVSMRPGQTAFHGTMILRTCHRPPQGAI